MPTAQWKSFRISEESKLSAGIAPLKLTRLALLPQMPLLPDLIRLAQPTQQFLVHLLARTEAE